MHGGPRAMRLPEHEHAEIQIQAHFSPTSLSRGAASIPETYRLIPSGKPHVGSWCEGSEVVVFLVHKRQLEMAGDELLSRGRYEPDEEIWGTDSVIHSVASVLRREFLSGTSDSRFLEAVRTVLSGHLVRSLGDSSVRRVRGRLAPRLLRQVVERMEENLGAGVSIPELAKHCRMGTHHFTQLFKASTGSSPYRYLLDLRTERAKELLATTSLSLAEIAYKLGFANQSHFATSFRRHTQFTPRQFRRTLQYGSERTDAPATVSGGLSSHPIGTHTDHMIDAGRRKSPVSRLCRRTAMDGVLRESQTAPKIPSNKAYLLPSVPQFANRVFESPQSRVLLSLKGAVQKVEARRQSNTKAGEWLSTTKSRS